ncbi:hypothetical protein [Bacteroides sp. 519]|uniref:hypothetical protein n=1 Tax=Bacteroides sp. 519 TaxID=2302937 RepID=UPI0013D56057|nr:hypothetical protein [Bacteroides sp. 519]NDV59313.1 hypothetical protein [Bacteroides sp. 519]
MNKIKNIFGILLALAAMTTFYSCDDEVKYTPAEKVDNAEVFFSPTNSTTVNLSNLSNSFQVAVARIKTDEAITVPLTVSDPSGFFTVPTSVSFEQGSANAVISIGYDYDDFEYDQFTELKLTIGDAYSTPYGISECIMSVGVPEPWSEWTEFGTGTYTYNQYLNGTHSGKLYKQQYLLDQDIARFKFDNILSSYGVGASLVLNFNNTTNQITLTEPIHVGDHDSYGEIYLLDVVTYANVIRGGTGNWAGFTYDEYPCSFNPETGLLTLNLIYYVGAGSFGKVGVPETFQLSGYADYSASVSYTGRFTDLTEEDYAIGNVIFGADVASAKVAMIEGKDIDAAVSGIIDGSLESIELKEGGKIEFPCAATGDYSFVVVTYNASGVAQKNASVSFKFTSSKDNAETWKSLGMGMYTEAIMGPIFEAPILSYEVEVQESESNPGKFRLVNPYGEAFPHNEPGDWDDSKNYYMEINAMDPEAVYIEYQGMGVAWGYGEFSIYSYAAYYLDNDKTLEDAKAAGCVGKYADGVITFPANTILWSMENLNNGNLSVSSSGDFKVVLPGHGRSVSTVAATTRSISKSIKVNPVKADLKINTLKVHKAVILN